MARKKQSIQDKVGLLDKTVMLILLCSCSRTLSAYPNFEWWSNNASIFSFWQLGRQTHCFYIIHIVHIEIKEQNELIWWYRSQFLSESKDVTSEIKSEFANLHLFIIRGAPGEIVNWQPHNREIQRRDLFFFSKTGNSWSTLHAKYLKMIFYNSNLWYRKPKIKAPKDIRILMSSASYKKVINFNCS